jgi:hypothetical protein
VVISESGLLRFVFQLIVRHSNTGSAMSSMDHYRSIDAIDGESALAPGAVISLRRTNRRFGPQASFMHRNKKLMLRWSIAGGKLQSLCRYSLRVDSNSRLLLAGIFEMLRYLPTDGQLDVTVDAHIDDHWAVFDRESLVDLAQIVGPIDSEAFSAEANS